jgi:hypothetical protein
MVYNNGMYDSGISSTRYLSARFYHRPKFLRSGLNPSPRRQQAIPSDEIIQARTAVFNTNEILQQILSIPPIGQLPSLRLVCKTWNSVANDVKVQVSPVCVHTDSVHHYQEYPETVPIVFNPAVTFWDGLKIRGSSNSVYDMDSKVDCALRSPMPRDCRNQFLTSPAVTQVILTGFPTKDESTTTLLEVRNGVRLKDLAKTIRKLGLDAGIVHPREGCKGHCVSAHIICTRSGSPGVSHRQRTLRMIMGEWKANYFVARD